MRELTARRNPAGGFRVQGRGMEESREGRLRFVRPAHQGAAQSFAAAVREGLRAPQKRLDCRFFYDTAGSRLFEQICALPEYYLTRAEQTILRRNAGEIVEVAGGNLALVEFGSGSSAKTRILFDAALARQDSLHYTSIDISADFLRATARTLLDDYPALTVDAVAAEYQNGIEHVAHHAGPRLFLFLGSNIGNFDTSEAAAFLSMVRRGMAPSDRLLLGADLVKDRTVLEAAYDDSAGITATFNRNILARINRELGGRFDLESFVHRAPWVESLSRIEMRLVSTRDQTVPVAALDETFHFRAGEHIHTESSRKYRPEDLRTVCGRAGMRIERCWTDPRGWFGVFLLGAAGS